ncbi:MAG TPA: response regulator transcription factor [Rugosimonospora sp.]|nr:response regulator transcription factor [Rugosimonospora sp.]
MSDSGEDRASLLLVEDDGELRELLARLLGEEGHRVDTAADGQVGLHRALTRRYGAMIIDRGLPGIDGLDLIRRLRRRGVGTPALVLTAYGAVADRVSGLDAGAEDYLVKPFEVDELLARVRALLRRHIQVAERIPLGGGHLDLAVRAVCRADGSEVDLSDREMVLLELLARRPGRVFTRDEIRERVFRGAESESIVDTYVHYLRRKLGNDVVRTVRGIGYRAGAL